MLFSFIESRSISEIITIAVHTVPDTVSSIDDCIFFGNIHNLVGLKGRTKVGAGLHIVSDIGLVFANNDGYGSEVT